MDTTIGQLLLNEALPPDMRDYARTLDKPGIKKLFAEVAEKYPQQYSDISHKFHNLAREVATTHGGAASLNIEALRTPQAVRNIHAKAQGEIDKILAGPGSQDDKDKKVVKVVSGIMDSVTKTNYEEGLREKNPFALQVLSGSRGNANQFRSLRGGALLVADHKDEPIPIPIMSSFSEGLDPVQYWASTYGARKGEIAKKFSSPKAGFLGKQLAMATHRLVVSEANCGSERGIPVAANEPDNEGAVLAHDVGKFKAGTVITLPMLKEMGDEKIMVRSPITCQSKHGVCQKCAGLRESGTFPRIGDNVGITAATALSEQLTQSTMNVRHGGGQFSGTHREGKTGLDLINQLVEVPKTFHGAAAISQKDGTVESIEAAPQGGQYIHVGGAEHWVPPETELKVKKGDTVEAGDVLSGGTPNPAEIVKHKGVGEGRRYFMELFKNSMQQEKFNAHRRNVELLARGLINHVRITDLDGPSDTVPDDVVEFDDMARNYKPRFGTKQMKPKQAVGLFLEQPSLHYSVGTRITPKVAQQLDQYKVPQVHVHEDTPSFEPEMTRAMETLAHTKDWMVGLGGFHLKKSLISATHRAHSSETHGTSFIPALAQGSEFGKSPTPGTY